MVSRLEASEVKLGNVEALKNILGNSVEKVVIELTFCTIELDGSEVGRQLDELCGAALVVLKRMEQETDNE